MVNFSPYKKGSLNIKMTVIKAGKKRFKSRREKETFYGYYISQRDTDISPYKW